MRPQVDVPGVGSCQLEAIESIGSDHYVCQRPGGGPEAVLIVIYPSATRWVVRPTRKGRVAEESCAAGSWCGTLTTLK